MTLNGNVTIWHYLEEDDAYSVKSYGCHVFGKTSTGDDGRGKTKKDAFTVRIPGKFFIECSLGDYIREGVFTDERPDKENCLMVSAVGDNRRGGQPHWRIDTV